MSIATKSSLKANFVNIQNPAHLLQVLVGSKWLYSKPLCWKLCMGKSDFKCRFNLLKMFLRNFNTELSIFLFVFYIAQKITPPGVIWGDQK